MRDGDTPHPRVFWEKSAQSIENKGREVGKKRQESSRVRKRLEGKEIEEVELMKEFKRGAWLGRGAGKTKLRRVFTSDARTDYRNCQYLNWVPVFRDWAQSRARAGVGDKGKSRPAPVKRSFGNNFSADATEKLPWFYLQTACDPDNVD